MRNWIQEKPNDFIKENMLSSRYNVDGHNVITSEDNELYQTGGESEKRGSEYADNQLSDDDFLPVSDNSKNEDGNVDSNLIENEEQKLLIELDNKSNDLDGQFTSELKVQPEKEYTAVEMPHISLEDARIKIGRAENSNHEIYWEYGNKGLANRHLLISGKSGQGKTYFMQCLLLEKSKLGLSSIVIDYTEGFLPNQLEPEFVEFLGGKLKQKIVYSEKLPYKSISKKYSRYWWYTIT